MNEIQIQGLTQNQVDLLDIMWAIESFEDFEAWILTLDRDVRCEVKILAELLILETMEELLVDTSEAKLVIQKIMNIDK